MSFLTPTKHHSTTFYINKLIWDINMFMADLSPSNAKPGSTNTGSCCYSGI